MVARDACWRHRTAAPPMPTFEPAALFESPSATKWHPPDAEQVGAMVSYGPPRSLGPPSRRAFFFEEPRTARASGRVDLSHLVGWTSKSGLIVSPGWCFLYRPFRGYRYEVTETPETRKARACGPCDTTLFVSAVQPAMPRSRRCSSQSSGSGTMRIKRLAVKSTGCCPVVICSTMSGARHPR